jgi:putative oxidoreductase
MASGIESRLNGYSGAVISLFRVVVGFLFALHGTSTMFGWPVNKGIAAFGSFPHWWSGVIELITGVLIMIGLFTRIAAFFASGEMAVAYFWQHQPHGLLPPQNGGEAATMYCFAFFLLVFVGAGAYGLDTWRRQRRRPAVT